MCADGITRRTRTIVREGVKCAVLNRLGIAVYADKLP